MSELLSRVPGLVYGFGTRAENLPRKFVDLGWESLRPDWKQVHGTGVAEVSAPGQPCGEVDALIALAPGLPIGVQTADCVPILLARRSGGACAAVHAGWRGTRARIVGVLAAALTERGERCADWVASIGPAIGPCCYEVSPELASDFAHEFGSARVQGRMLDLPALNADQLRGSGFGEVEVQRACTRCVGPLAAPTYHSYRREGRGVRQWSLIVAG